MAKEAMMKDMSMAKGKPGHLYMQTNEVKNAIIHYERSSTGALTEVERISTGGAGSGEFKPISEFDMFEVEYWSLEQAKLGKSNEKALARQVAVITGGGSGIGAAMVEAFVRQGAKVFFLDIADEEGRALQSKLRDAAYPPVFHHCDLTDIQAVQATRDFTEGKYLVFATRQGVVKKTEFLAYQASPRGGLVRVRVHGSRVRLGGQAVTVLRGSLLA